MVVVHFIVPIRAIDVIRGSYFFSTTDYTVFRRKQNKSHLIPGSLTDNQGMASAPNIGGAKNVREGVMHKAFACLLGAWLLCHCAGCAEEESPSVGLTVERGSADIDDLENVKFSWGWAGTTVARGPGDVATDANPPPAGKARQFDSPAQLAGPAAGGSSGLGFGSREIGSSLVGSTAFGATSAGSAPAASAPVPSATVVSTSAGSKSVGSAPPSSTPTAPTPVDSTPTGRPSGRK